MARELGVQSVRGLEMVGGNPQKFIAALILYIKQQKTRDVTLLIQNHTVS